MITRELLNPKSIAVIGGSNDINKPGGRSLYNLLQGNYEELYVVNPKENEVQGIKCYANVNDLPNIELGVICIASKFVEETIKVLCEEKGTKAIIIVSAGFSEIGAEGKIIEERIVDICNANKCALIGPNCIGMLMPTYQAVIAGPIPRLENTGCDFVTSSGATAVYILEEAIARGLSFASVYSVGNGAQISVENVLEYWDNTFELGKSPTIKMIYIESVNEPQKLLMHSQSLVRKGAKICAVKSGRSSAGARAATSHTGALAGSDAAVEALFKKAGIIRCEGRFDLINVATILKNRELTGNNVAIITHAGGPGVMLTDTLENEGMQIPKIEGKKAEELQSKLFYGSSVANPIDCLVTGTPTHIATILDYIENDFSNIDASAVIYGNSGLFSPEEVYKITLEQTKKCKKPIYHIVPSPYRTPEFTKEIFKKGHTIFTDEVAFGKALGKVYNFQKTYKIEKDTNDFKIDKQRIRNIIDNSKSEYLSPEKVQNLLDFAGIRRTDEYIIKDENELKNVLNGANLFPIVMKVIGILHKSDVGGVKLNITNQDDAILNFNQMMQIKDAKGVLIQPMLKGTELFVGAKKENNFGHLILCGMGGIFIEILKDIQNCLVPVNFAEAKEMIKNLKAYKIIQGIRGKDGINEDVFAEIIIRLSNLLEVAPEISELDINPLLANKDSIIAVDARILIEK